MKRNLICLLMILSLLLCGCSGQKDAPVSGQVTSQETEAAQVTTEPERNASLGRIEDGVYTNEYVGFGCELDSSWVFYSAEELQQLPENIAQMLEGTEVGDTMSEITQITDMMAENEAELTTMNVLYTKLSVQERLAYALLSEREILEQVLEQKDMLISSYAQAGIEVSDMEIVTVSFLGQERSAVLTTATVQGVPYYILQLYHYDLGQYGVVVTFSSFLEDNTRSMLDLFYSIE